MNAESPRRPKHAFDLVIVVLTLDGFEGALCRVMPARHKDSRQHYSDTTAGLLQQENILSLTGCRDSDGLGLL